MLYIHFLLQWENVEQFFRVFSLTGSDFFLLQTRCRQCLIPTDSLLWSVEVRADVCQRLNCFPPRMKAMFAELKHHFSHSLCSTWNEKVWNDEVAATKCIALRFCSLPLEIMSVYSVSSSEKLLLTFTWRPVHLCGNSMQIFCCRWIQDEFWEGEKNTFSLHAPLVFLPAVWLSPLCCDAYVISALGPKPDAGVSRPLAAEHCHRNVSNC